MKGLVMERRMSRLNPGQCRNAVAFKIPEIWPNEGNRKNMRDF